MRSRGAALLVVCGATVPGAAQLFGVGGGGPSGGSGTEVKEKSDGGISSVGGGAGTGTGNSADEVEDGSEDADSSDGGIIFSVDPDSVGVGSRQIPNVGVHHQFLRRQQAGDAFITTEAFNVFEGRLPPPVSMGLLDDVLVINQNEGWTDNIGFGLFPPVSPFVFMPPGTVIDDLDFLARRQNGPQGNPRIFFTVTNDSPSLLTLPGQPQLGRGSDIFFDPDITIPGNELLYAPAQMLLLLPGDEIDALIVFDQNDNRVFDTVDRVLFSLDRGSPSLDIRGLSPADILVAAPFQLEVFARHFELGLEPGDDLDAMLWRPLVGPSMETTIETLLAGLNACSADISGSADPNSEFYGFPDGVVDSSDFFYFLDQFVAGNADIADLSGSSDPNDPSYGVPDGSIDAADFFYYLDLFTEGCS